MKYSEYTLNDFATDDYFIQWVKNPDDKSNLFWKNWIKNNPEKEEIIDEARQLVSFLNFAFPETEQDDFNEVKSKLFQQIKENKESSRQQEIKKPAAIRKELPQKNRSKSYFNLYKAAAVFIGLIILTGLYFILFPATQFTEYKTAFGETKDITLPDHSTVTLNANSVLKVKTNWDDNDIREVWLEGEAFFDVAEKLRENSQNEAHKDPIKFVVRVSTLDVEVIGTKFNVNNRRGTTEVVLKSGKVKLQSHYQASHLEMLPGEFVEYQEKDKTFRKRNVEPETYASWRNNKLIFDNQPLHEIFKILEDHYGFEVILDHPDIAQLRFTGTTPLDNVDILFTSIKNSFNVTIQQHSNQIFIRKITQTQP